MTSATNELLSSSTCSTTQMRADPATGGGGADRSNPPSPEFTVLPAAGCPRSGAWK